MLSLEEGIAIDGIFKTRKWSRSREMVFGHSIRKSLEGFSLPVILKILMGLNGLTEPCCWKRRDVSSLHVSSHAFGGPAQKASQMCFHQGKKKITGSLPKHLSHSLSFPGSLPLALTLRQLMWGWGAPHLRTGQSHLSSFTLPRGPAVGAMGRMCQAITRQSTPQRGDGVKL